MNAERFTFKALVGSTIALSLLLSLGLADAQATAARAAKDAGETKKALAESARYLQTHGFMDAMLTVENIDHKFIDVEVHDDHWKKMTREQKADFLNKVNDYALGGNGGVAVEIRVSMLGSTVGASTFTSGQQTIRLAE
jgi:hypothetical protein